MKKIVCILLLIVPLLFSHYFTYGQCDINADCANTPILSIDPPVFDLATSSIILNNITFGEFACTAGTYQTGIAIYLYQLLPNGSRMEFCNVVNAAPFNVVGSITFGFGQTSFCDSGTTNIGSLPIGLDEGFEVCDGAFIEVEAVLFITDNMGFDPSTSSVYSELNANEFISSDLGNVSININNEFPGGGQPLTTAIINELDTGSEGPISASCGDDVQLYVEGLSRLANCLEYDDIYTGISSELENELYYSINGEAPIFVQSPATGAAGGQLTGPDPNLGGLCYAGILGPYTFAWANLPQDLCDGSSVVVTITTTDIFTGQTLSDQIEIIYTGAVCAAPCQGVPGCTDPCDPNYDPNATENDPALCAGYDDTCNADCMMGPFGGTWDSATCSCINEITSFIGCTDFTACNYIPNSNCDDGSCDFGVAGCADPCNPVNGCTDDTACNYNPDACVDDGSCQAPPCNPGCTDQCADNYDPNADADDGSCNPYDAPVNGCTDNSANNYDPNANCDDGSCTFASCDDPCAPNFGAAEACEPYDTTCNQDCTVGLFGGTWDAATCSCVNETTPVIGCTDTGANNYDPNANCDDGSCIAGVCEEEITGSITTPDEGCDVSGLEVTITAPDGTTVIVITDADGTFTIPNGPFPCGNYSATITDANVPACFLETGDIGPIQFIVDGDGNGDDGPFFTANPMVPTLSQWGLIILALLLMSFGAVTLYSVSRIRLSTSIK